MNTSPDRRTRTPKRRGRSSLISYMLVSVLITSLVVLLASCSLTGGDNNNLFAPNDTTATPLPTVSVPTPTPRVQHAVVLRSIRMFDTKNGWALTRDNRVLRTNMGAGQWQDITPTISWSEYELVAPDFLDSQHAWVGVQAGDKFSIFSTNDGGNIWIESPIPENSDGIGITQIDFINADEGWLLFNKSRNTNQEIADIFATKDNGSTWINVASTDTPQGEASSLPIAGSTQIGLHFLDENTGWVTGVDPTSGRVTFVMTQDGGTNWQSSNLTLPSTALKDAKILTLPPVFFDEKNGLMPVLFLGGSSTQLNLYTSQDSGQHWGTSSTITVASTIKDESALSFIDAHTGWIVGPNNTLLHTSDAGKHWSTLTMRLPAGVTAITQLNFVSSTTAWVIGSQGNTQTLLQSVDGGNTWTSVNSNAI